MSFRKSDNESKYKSKNKPKSQKQIIKENQLLEQGMDWYFLIPLAMIGAFVPTVVYLQIIEIPDHIARFWTTTQNWDFFAYHKARWLLIFTGISFLAMLLGLLQQTVKITWDKIFIPMGIYAFFIVLSTVFVDPIYRDIALSGFPDRHEGMYVQLSYLLVMFMAMVMVRNERHIQLIIGSLLASASFLSVVGIFQYLGMDFFRTEFGRNFIVPSFYEGAADSLTFHFGPQTIYTSFYNTNYTGSYMAMVTIIALVLFLYAQTNRSRTLYALATILTFSNLIGSNSRAGLVGFALGMIVVIALSYKRIMISWKRVITIGLSLTLIIVSMNIISDGRITNSIKSLYTGSKTDTIITSDENIPTRVFRDLTLNDNRATLDMTSETLTVELVRVDDELDYYVSDVTFYDSEGNILDIVKHEEDSVGEFTDPRYQDYYVIVAGNYIQLTVGEFSMPLGVDYNGGIKYVNPDQELVDLNPAQSFGFKGRETMGSSRGYIWSRSIPLLADTMLIGYGPDTYAIYYPQDDYIAKMKYISGAATVVDKPHNQYLQIGINTGIISLLAFLYIMVLYYIKIFTTRRRLSATDNDTSINYSPYAIGLVGAITAYLIAGIFNDSIVSVSPVFWLILGLGYKIVNTIEENAS